MIRTCFLFIFSILLLTRCGHEGKRPNSESLPVVPESSAAVDPSDGGLLSLPLTSGQGRMLIRKEPRQTVYVNFNTEDYRKMSAEINPQTDSAANLRISQVILPDGTADGPFGRTVQVDIPSSGNMRLLIGESLMQGDPWGGGFELKVSLDR